MVWLYRLPIPVGRRGVISSDKWFLPAFPRLGEGGGGRHPVQCAYAPWSNSPLGMNEDVQDLLVWEALAEGGGGEGGGREDRHQEEHQDTGSHPAPLLHIKQNV